MATTRSFSSMINEYLPNDLLKEELVKRDWFLQNVTMDDGWNGGNLIVPMKAAGASTVSFGALAGATDIAESNYLRGYLSTQPEVWSSLFLNQRDLMEHGKLSEQNLLKLLPDEIDGLMGYFKEVVSHSFLTGPWIAKATADGSSGAITVDHPERFVIGQKVYVDDDDSSAVAGYVTAINMDTGVLTVQDARSSGSAVNLSAYTVAQNAVLYFEGAQTAGNRLTSLRSQLLSNANGGGTTIANQTKASYPILQAVNISGAAWTSTTFLQDIFDAYVTIRQRGKGDPNKAVMSFRNLGYCMTILEQQKGAYHIDQSSTKVNAFGWTEIVVFGPKGRLTLVGITEMENDCVYFLDMRGVKVYSNGGFKKRTAPDGKMYYEVRATSGYYYIIDVCFFGDCVLQFPSYCGIAHSIA